MKNLKYICVFLIIFSSHLESCISYSSSAIPSWARSQIIIAIHSQAKKYLTMKFRLSSRIYSQTVVEKFTFGPVFQRI